MKFTKTFSVEDWILTINGNLKGLKVTFDEHGIEDPIVQLFEIRPDNNLELMNNINVQVAITPQTDVFVVGANPVPFKIIIK